MKRICSDDIEITRVGDEWWNACWDITVIRWHHQDSALFFLIVRCVHLNDSKQDVGRWGRRFEVVPHFALSLFAFRVRNETVSC